MRNLKYFKRKQARLTKAKTKARAHSRLTLINQQIKANWDEFNDWYLDTHELNIY